MLTEIYNAIKSDEIVMPAEHTGLVRESYLWKLMLKRTSSSGEKFLHTPSGSYNYDIFTLVWGQTMAALSFVFEKSNYDLVIQKSIEGFSKCARIAAHYSMSDVFDNLVISLCKFTTLLTTREVKIPSYLIDFIPFVFRSLIIRYEGRSTHQSIEFSSSFLVD